MKKKALVLLLAFAMVCAYALSACGGGSDSSEEGSEGAVLRVVTEATFAPFEFTEDGEEEIKGFDVDMMNAIAEDQGLQIEFMNM